MITWNTKCAKALFALLAAVIVEFAWYHVGYLTSWLGLPSHTALNSAAKDLVMMLLVAAILLLVIKPKEIGAFLGLNAHFTKGMLVAVISVSPLYLVFPLIGSINPDLNFALFARQCLLPGFIEELIWRAFMFGLFFRYAKVGFFWAIWIPALLFGIPHMYQGEDLLSSLAAIGVTFLGAVYFSWMYTAWHFNLWAPIGLHMLMNAAWVIFNVTGTEVAAGGLISNIVRLVSIALAILLTLCYHKKRGERLFDYPIWRF